MIHWEQQRPTPAVVRELQHFRRLTVNDAIEGWLRVLGRLKSRGWKLWFA